MTMLQNFQSTDLLSPEARLGIEHDDRIRQLGGPVPDSPLLITNEVRIRVTQELLARLPQLGRQLQDALHWQKRDRLDLAIEALDDAIRERDRIDYVCAEHERQARVLAEARAKPAPAAWREVDADAPAVVDREVFAARLANERYVRTHLMTKRDELLVDLEGEVNDALRRIMYALGPVAQGSAFYATADQLMPKRPQFKAPALAANETAPSWLVKLADDIGSIQFPSPPAAPSVSSLRRTGDPFADQAHERDVHEGHTAAVDAWRDGSARAHEALAGSVKVARDALTPGCPESFWLDQLLCHVTGQRALIERDIVLRALSMTSVWNALVNANTSNKGDTTSKASKGRTR